MAFLYKYILLALSFKPPKVLSLFPEVQFRIQLHIYMKISIYLNKHILTKTIYHVFLL